MCKVAFDGEQISNLSDEEQSIAKKIFGGVFNIDDHARNLFTEVAGARAGKSFLCALRLLHLALTVKLGSLAAGEEGLVIVVAPALKQAEQVINYIKGCMERSPALRSMLVGKPLKTRIRIRRDNGQVVSIEPRAAAQSGLTGRGFSIVSALMDEAAMFRGTDYKLNDEEILSAMYQRILPGGQLLVASTPWAREGLLWRLFEENWGHPQHSICAYAPTLLMAPTQRNIDRYAMVKKGDPDRAAREYDAEFLSAAAEVFFDPVTIERSIDEGLNGGLPPPEPGTEVKAGADFGFERDSSALCIVYAKAGLTKVAGILHRTPDGDSALKPSEVVDNFAEHCRYHMAGWVMSDIHYRQSIIEHLNENNLSFIESPTDPADPYVTTRILLHQGLVKIPRNPKLIQQLKMIRAKRTTGGRISIIKPRLAGSHCDIADAFVLAVFQAAGATIPYQNPDTTTPEGQRWLNDNLKEQRRVTQYREYDTRLNGKWWKVSPDKRIR